MNKVRLLPCPFCGGPPVPVVTDQKGGIIYPETLFPIDEQDGTHAEAYVFCHECGAQSGAVWMHDALKAGASTIVHDAEDCRKLLDVAVVQWNDRSMKCLDLYTAGDSDPGNFYPR